MNRDELKRIWKAEEETAHVRGWDFSPINGKFRIHTDEMPWNYTDVVKSFLTPEKRILDIDTGGGELLLSFGHPYNMTAATEAYPPNVKVCEETLKPLGIDFQSSGDYTALPFKNGSFDVVLNSHGEYSIPEIKRILKPGGIFITEQVGELNDRELVTLLCPEAKPLFKGWNLKNEASHFEKSGFKILKREEFMCPIEFFDVGALVWFARVIEWEFLGFSVERNLERLYEAQRILEEQGKINGHAHRFLIVAKK